MGKKPHKHDWIQYKKEYFLSDYKSAYEFVEKEKGIVGADGFSRNLKGWRDEKEALEDSDSEELKAQIRQQKGWTIKKILQTKWDAISLLHNKLASQLDGLSVKDLDIVINRLRIEAKEPLTTSENLNKNQNSDQGTMLLAQAHERIAKALEMRNKKQDEKNNKQS